ncbi:uncharacterized protein LOC136035968 [Artemia franciscana]|uniref:uncharacterized protein LOC136035968 n=1 Tax=Artemia franciscana TaxID=6661 RepID=UPI0032DB71CB
MSIGLNSLIWGIFISFNIGIREILAPPPPKIVINVGIKEPPAPTPQKMMGIPTISEIPESNVEVLEKILMVAEVTDPVMQLPAANISSGQHIEKNETDKVENKKIKLGNDELEERNSTVVDKKGEGNMSESQRLKRDYNTNHRSYQPAKKTTRQVRPPHMIDFISEGGQFWSPATQTKRTIYPEDESNFIPHYLEDMRQPLAFPFRFTEGGNAFHQPTNELKNPFLSSQLHPEFNFMNPVHTDLLNHLRIIQNYQPLPVQHQQSQFHQTNPQMQQVLPQHVMPNPWQGIDNKLGQHMLVNPWQRGLSPQFYVATQPIPSRNIQKEQKVSQNNPTNQPISPTHTQNQQLVQNQPLPETQPSPKLDLHKEESPIKTRQVNYQPQMKRPPYLWPRSATNLPSSNDDDVNIEVEQA